MTLFCQNNYDIQSLLSSFILFSRGAAALCKSSNFVCVFLCFILLLFAFFFFFRQLLYTFQTCLHIAEGQLECFAIMKRWCDGVTSEANTAERSAPRAPIAPPPLDRLHSKNGRLAVVAQNANIYVRNEDERCEADGATGQNGMTVIKNVASLMKKSYGEPEWERARLEKTTEQPTKCEEEKMENNGTAKPKNHLWVVPLFALAAAI